jgi:hypothetical protein
MNPAVGIGSPQDFIVLSSGFNRAGWGDRLNISPLSQIRCTLLTFLILFSYPNPIDSS